MASPLAGVLTAKCFLAVLLVLVLSSSPRACQGAAQNITAILAARPDLGEFSTLLASTGLADGVNQRTTPVTVLAVDDAGMAPLRAQGVPPEAVLRTLSVHVLLDYFDDATLRRFRPTESARVHTMLKPSANAAWGTGMLMVVREPNGTRFDFEPMGNPARWRYAVFVESVYQAPGDLSVLRVSCVMSVLPTASTKTWTGIRNAADGEAAAADAPSRLRDGDGGEDGAEKKN